MAAGEMSYKPGTIRKLKLINFMCHESFELEFGPRANFIIGPNGSGKSALLTALVVVLGGRASSTSRAKRASDFVKYGKRFARIICELHNYDKVMQMNAAFKPDEYGKFIVIERTIMNDEVGGTRLVIKNDRLQRVSERKQELDELLDHFGILINNPICILNQEVSKTFLHSKRPEDKFELFLKATNLDQIENDYNECKQNHVEWKDVNDRKEIGFRLLDNEYQMCKEKINFLNHRIRLEDNLQKLFSEGRWAALRDQEENAKLKSTAIDEAESGVKIYEADIAKCRDSIEESELKVEKYRIKVETCNQESEKSKKKVADTSKKYNEARVKQVDIQHALDECKSKLARLEREKARHEKAIEEVQRRLNDNSTAQDTEKRKLEITQLEREIETEKARDTSIRQHATQLSNSMVATRGEQNNARLRLETIKNNLAGKNAILKRLVAGQGNEIEKYGAHIFRIHQEVEKAHKEGRFIKKPIGPLGLYIKLKSEDIAAALEVHLGRNAGAFVCDNIKDLAALNLIIHKVRTSSGDPYVKDPIVMTRKFGRRHDVSRYKVQHDHYKTMLDYIDIEEDSVFNVIVDRTSLEQILFIPEYNEAQNLMITSSSIPRNTRCAYTRDCYVMHPRTAHSGYRCMANNRKCVLFAKKSDVQIRETQREIELLKREEAEAITAKERIDLGYEKQRSESIKIQEEITSIQRRLRENEIRLLDLKTTMTEAQSDELPGLEADLEKCLGLIHGTKLNIERESSKMTAIIAELADLTTEKKSNMEVLKHKERERQQVNDNITKEKDTIKKYQDEIDQFKLGINRLRHNIDQFKDDLADIHSNMSEAQRLLPDEPRPDTITPTDTIKREVEKIKAQLRVEIEEGQDSEELVQILNKRMFEIEQIVKLKDQNLGNYGQTEKSLKAREEGFKTLRNITRRSVGTTFTSVMNAMGMMGQLNIYLEDKIEDGKVVAKAKTLEMSIDTSPSQRPVALNANNSEAGTPNRRETRSQPELSGDDGPRSKRARLNVSPSEKENKKMTDTRSLSGGERSFSTVAFVLSLWHHCVSPFKLMDEIDVFMDMVTRRMSYNALITFAEVTDHSGQFIFFSPLELPKLDRAENLVRVFEMPRIIRRGIHSQPEGGDEPMSMG